MKNLLFLLAFVGLFASCTKEVADSKRLGSEAAQFKTFQYDILEPAGRNYKWRHFKWSDNRLLFDSIPNRFQFEEKRADKIAVIKAFMERFPVVLMEKKSEGWTTCVHFMYTGALAGVVTRGTTNFEWALDPSAYCNEAILSPFIAETYTFFDKMNQ